MTLPVLPPPPYPHPASVITFPLIPAPALSFSCTHCGCPKTCPLGREGQSHWEVQQLEKEHTLMHGVG